MYTDFYKLVERPFELTPDPRYVYLSAHHREALAHLKYGVEERKGFIQLTGEVGTGKTTMLDVLASELDASTAVAKLSYTTIDELDLLRVLARGYAIDAASRSKAEILDLLRDRLSQWAAEGKNAVFIVDEAQNLSLPVLEEIRLLSNLRANGKLGLQIVLAGQPELRDKLETTELRQLRQRIGIRYHLTPLSRHETSEYVAHRMAVAGASERVFQPDALDAIYEHSKGVPRVINMICDRALLGGYARNMKRVTADIVLQAIRGLEGVPADDRGGIEKDESPPASPAPRPARRRSRRGNVRWAPAVAASLTVVAIVTGAVLYFEGREGAALSPGEEALAARTAVTDTIPDVHGAPARPATLDGEGTKSDSTEAGETVPVARTEPGGEAAVVDVADEKPRGASGPAEDSGLSDLPGARAVPDQPVGASLIDDVPVGPYLIVAASSRNIDAANRQADELRANGMDAVVWTVDLEERGTWHRIVLAASFDSLSAASRAAEVLQRLGYEDAWVVRR